jgi:hypothetical protein
MYIFNGTYSWDGKKRDGRDPIAWFPGAYQLRIVNLSSNREGITPLKTHLCVFSETGQGHSISAKPLKFAQHICTDFSLDIERVLWVEKIEDTPGTYEILILSRNGKLGNEMFYRVERRLPTEAEQRLIEKSLALQQ